MQKRRFERASSNLVLSVCLKIQQITRTETVVAKDCPFSACDPSEELKLSLQYILTSFSLIGNTQ